MCLLARAKTRAVCVCWLWLRTGCVCLLLGVFLGLGLRPVGVGSMARRIPGLGITLRSPGPKYPWMHEPLGTHAV